MLPEAANKLFDRVYLTRTFFYGGPDERSLAKFVDCLDLPVLWDVENDSLNVYSDKKWNEIPPNSYVSVELGKITTISPRMDRFYYTNSFNGKRVNISCGYEGFLALKDGHPVTIDGWTFAPFNAGGNTVRVYASGNSRYSTLLKMEREGVSFKFVE